VVRQDSYRGNWTIRNEKVLTLNDKVMYIIYDLTQFNKPLEEIKTNEDRWLYLLKHAGKAESLPDFGNDIIAKAIRRILVKAAPEKLLKEQANDMVLTEEQLDHLAWLKVNAENKLRAECANNKAREIAAKMLAKNMPIDEIAEFTGLSETEILAIKAEQAQ
jgi:predicted transposase/invertase (TIGR01784 family)